MVPAPGARGSRATSVPTADLPVRATTAARPTAPARGSGATGRPVATTATAAPAVPRPVVAGERRPGYRAEGRDRRSADEVRVPAPPLPDDVTAAELDAEVRRDLRGLQKETAETVARHLVAAGSLVDDDPDEALAHARYARYRASRIASVREAAGIAAYHAGEWTEALGELRAARRMGGGPGHLAVMADIERALGRPERAIDLARGPEARELGRAEAIELAIVAAGARRDLGELDAAVVGLQLPELDPARREPWSARLFYAYADNLAAAGREPEAVQWFVHAADADDAGETDAAARLAELTGEPLPDDDVEFGEEDIPAAAERAGTGGRRPRGRCAATPDATPTSRTMPSSSRLRSARARRATTRRPDRPPTTSPVAAQPIPVSPTRLSPTCRAVRPTRLSPIRLSSMLTSWMIPGGPTARPAVDDHAPRPPRPRPRRPRRHALPGPRGDPRRRRRRPRGAATGACAPLYVTNNASRSPGDVAAHLAELGYPADADDVATSSQAAAALLAEQLPDGAKVLVVGTAALAAEISAVGLTPTDPRRRDRRRPGPRPPAAVRDARRGLHRAAGGGGVGGVQRRPDAAERARSAARQRVAGGGSADRDPARAAGGGQAGAGADADRRATGRRVGAAGGRRPARHRHPGRSGGRDGDAARAHRCLRRRRAAGRAARGPAGLRRRRPRSARPRPGRSRPRPAARAGPSTAGRTASSSSGPATRWTRCARCASATGTHGGGPPRVRAHGDDAAAALRALGLVAAAGGAGSATVAGADAVPRSS